jgi:5'-3' exonuclease
MNVDFPFLHVMFLPKLPSNDLQNALFTIMVFQRAIPLIKKHITANEVLQLAHAQEIHSYHVYNHQEVFLKEQKNCLLEFSYTANLLQHLPGWNNILRKIMYTCSESVSNM